MVNIETASVASVLREAPLKILGGPAIKKHTGFYLFSFPKESIVTSLTTMLRLLARIYGHNPHWSAS
jgi:hypothetical protein